MLTGTGPVELLRTLKGDRMLPPELPKVSDTLALAQFLVRQGDPIGPQCRSGLPLPSSSLAFSSCIPPGLLLRDQQLHCGVVIKNMVGVQALEEEFASLQLGQPCELGAINKCG